MILATLAAYYISTNSASRTSSESLSSDNRETISASPYIQGQTPQVLFGEIKNSDNAYIHLKLRFQANSTEGNPNVFQTAPVNRGMRMEISGATAAIVLPDTSVLGGLKGLTLTTTLKTNQWYELEVEALNGKFVQVKLDGGLVADYASLGISMEMSQLLVGGGFDASRAFRGQIDHVSITKGNLPQVGHSFFTSISNSGILFFSLVSFIIVVLTKKVCSSFFDNLFIPQRNFSITTLGLLFIQILLMIFLPPYRNLLVVYLFLFLIGINQYILFTPSFLKDKFSYFILAPLNGLLLLSVLGSYFIGFSFKINWLVPTLLCFCIIAHVCNLKLNRDIFISTYSKIKKDYAIALIVYTFVITPIILCLILPALLTDFSTSTYRVGPDMGSYAKMAQYLLDGGTWTEASQRSVEFIGMSPGEINRYSDATMSWPLMYYFRWGLTAYQAAVTTITFSNHSFETAFVSMAVPYLLMCGLVLIWLKQHMGLGFVAALTGAIAFAFNSNMLNIWYEGFYGNAYALPLIIPILYIFLRLRSNENISVGDLRKSIIFSTTLFAASLLSYAEGVVFVLASFMIFVFVVDLIAHKSIKWRPYLIVLCSACIGLIIVLPCGFILEWALLAIKQITQEGGNGYPQPLWALPHEILGFSNIYLNTSVDLVGQPQLRTPTTIFSGVLFSLFILYSILVYFRNSRKKENVLYVTGMLMVAVAACFVYYKTPDNNYTYMKMYVFLLPLLFVLFWGSLHTIYGKYFSKSMVLNPNWLHLFVAIPIIASGTIYIIQYTKSSIPIEQSRIELAQEIKQTDFSNVILYPVLIHKESPIKDILYRDMYPAILPVPWLIPTLWDSAHWKGKPYYKNYLNHKVYLFIEKSKGHSYTPTNGSVVFQNQNYLIIDSGRTVKDGVNNDGKSMNFDIYTRTTNN